MLTWALLGSNLTEFILFSQAFTYPLPVLLLLLFVCFVFSFLDIIAAEVINVHFSELLSRRKSTKYLI